MIVTCEKCKSRYRLDERRIEKPAFNVKCSNCEHSFVVYKTAQLDESCYLLRPEASATKQTPAPPACRVLCVCNQKGGVAKTSTCLNLAGSLSLQNKRVLLIDFDVQANLSLLLGHRNVTSFFEALNTDGGDLSKAIIKANHNFWLLPSNSRMALASKKYLNEPNFEYLLRERLAKIKKVFDFVIIDTPPSGDFFALNALLASDLALIPTQCEYLAMSGVGHIENMIHMIREKAGHKLDYRVLTTLYDPTSTVEQVIRKKLESQYKERLLRTLIERDSKIQESQIAHMPVLFYDKSSRAGQQYMRLAQELLSPLEHDESLPHCQGL